MTAFLVIMFNLLEHNEERTIKPPPHDRIRPPNSYRIGCPGENDPPNAVFTAGADHSGLTGESNHPRIASTARDDKPPQKPTRPEQNFEQRQTLTAYSPDLACGYFAADRDTTWSRQIDPATLTWEQFLRKSGWHGEPIVFAH